MGVFQSSSPDQPLSAHSVNEAGVKNPPAPTVAPYFEVPARRREDELAQAKQAGAPVCPWESTVTLLNRKIWGHRPLTL
jgi:hypothetical protein